MKAKGLKKDKVNIVTLGCSKNLVDSEEILTQLKGNGVDTTHEASNDDANIVVINTCGFIDNAKQESIDTILRYVDAKEEGLVDKVYVTGYIALTLNFMAQLTFLPYLNPVWVEKATEAPFFRVTVFLVLLLPHTTPAEGQKVWS